MVDGSEDGALEFEKLTAPDLPFILEVRNECRNFLHDDRTFTLDECRVWFEEQKPEFLLIKLDGVPIGYFRVSNFDPTTSSIYVGADLHARYRGQGLGRRAYEQFLPTLSERYEVASARLEVLSHNVRALSLYRTLGFVEIDRHRGFAVRDGGAVDSIVMERRVSPR
jgi:ribosomal protein S18 acetylase RimI-like enzyme